MVDKQLGAPLWGNVLEAGCAEGHFTEKIAAKCSSLTAVDISPIACSRAKERCVAFPHVRVEQLNLERDPIPGTYDLIFAMDVLDFFSGRRRLGKVVSKLLTALRDSGLLAITATRLPADMERCWWARWLSEGGLNIVDFIQGHASVRLLDTTLHPEAGHTIPGYCNHVMAVFQKVLADAPEHRA